MYDVITVGSATVDCFAHTDSELISIRKGATEEHFLAYPTGTKILIEKLDFQIGGGGTNSAVSFARLGLVTGFLGKLGNDSNADRILKLLKREKVDFLGPIAKGRTGYSVILDSIDDDRTILTFKGVNDKLILREINKKKLLTRWLYFSSMTGDSYKTLENIAVQAKKRKTKIAFNPSSYLAKEGLVKLGKLLRLTDFLVLNREEAEILLGQTDIKKLLRALNKLGPHIIAITNGADGVYVSDHNHYYHLPANDVKVVETTGAGDAFGSGFVAGLIIEGDVIFAMHLGLANATSVIKHLGAKNKLLTFTEAKKAIRKNSRIRKL